VADRDEILTFLGLPTDASLWEIESAYLQRRQSARERLQTGDESARVELALIEQAYDRLIGAASQAGARTALETRPEPDEGEAGEAALPPPAFARLRTPAWWESYLALLATVVSLGLAVWVVTYLPHVFADGGFLLPVGVLAASGALAVGASLLAQGELRVSERADYLRDRGLEPPRDSVAFRGSIARVADIFARGARWLIALVFIGLVICNFHAMHDHWRLFR
jgi:hypothetical protein